MKPYQERYIENLKLVMSLSDFSADTPGDIPLFIEERKRKNGQIRQIIAENTESLRRNLMPLLDNIVSAPEDEIRELEDFASHLMQGARQLDLVLNYMIRSALVSYARMHEQRDMLIRQLYHTGMALFYMQQIIRLADRNDYNWRMSMMFGEAAAFIKKYDEIELPETRGYIHRSMANLVLAYNWSDPWEAGQKTRAIRRSFQVLTDPVYHEKTPSLPWDVFIYKSHQERTTAMILLRRGNADPEIVREVMQSAEFIWKKQMKDSQERGVRPSARWILEYDIALYHCGIHTLPQLLQRMEEVYLDQDDSDFSESGMWGNVLLPAFYSEYMHFDPPMIRNKKTFMLHMYRRMVEYVRRVPNGRLNSLLVSNLLDGFNTFIEYPDGISARDFLINLVICRDPDIYVYLQLTADTSQMIMQAALEQIPEQLVGVLSCSDIAEIQSRRREILQFTYECGLLHDIGLFLFGSLVTMAARSRFEEEQKMYHYHVNAGKQILSRCQSTRVYVPAALGHHRYYNEKGGYPEEYRRADDPNVQVTDIVAIASCMIGLTNAKFNQNRLDLPFSDALQSILDRAGTRFSPVFTALLPGLRPQLDAYMETAAIRAYEKAFELLQG